MSRTRSRVIALIMLVFIMAGAGIGYAAIPNQTIGNNGLTLPWLNATQGINIGTNTIIDASRDATLNSVDVQELYLNSVNKTDIFAYPQQPFSHVFWRDGDIYYSKDGTTGIITTSNSIETLISSQLTDGDSLVLKDGNYSISTPFINTSISNWSLEGQGNSTLIFLEDGSDCHIIIIGDGTTTPKNINIKNIRIDGNRANQGAGVFRGIHSRRASFVDIDSVNAVNIQAQSFLFTSCVESGVRNSHAINSGNFGYEIHHEATGSQDFSEYCYLTNNVADNCHGAFQIAHTRYSTFSDLRGYNYGSRGFGVMNECYGNEINNLVLIPASDGHGITFWWESEPNAASAIYSNNHNTFSNLYIDGTASTATTSGIDLYGPGSTKGYAYFNTFTNFYIKGFRNAGIHITSNCDNNYFGVGEIVNNYWAGVYNVGSGLFNYFVDLVIVDNCIDTSTQPHGSDSGIVLGGEYGLVQGCTIKNVVGSNQDYGVESFESAYLYTIRDNLFLSHAVSGIKTTSDTSSIRRIHDNVGFVTENRGNATLAAITGSIVVNHGCEYTPALGDIQVTPNRDLGNCTYYWYDTITATQFTIHVGSDGSEKNIDKEIYFLWSVIRNN